MRSTELLCETVMNLWGRPKDTPAMRSLAIGSLAAGRGKGSLALPHAQFCCFPPDLGLGPSQSLTLPSCQIVKNCKGLRLILFASSQVSLPHVARQAEDLRFLGQSRRNSHPQHSRQLEIHVCIESSCPAPQYHGDHAKLDPAGCFMRHWVLHPN